MKNKQSSEQKGTEPQSNLIILRLCSHKFSLPVVIIHRKGINPHRQKEDYNLWLTIDTENDISCHKTSAKQVIHNLAKMHCLKILFVFPEKDFICNNSLENSKIVPYKQS